MYEGASVDVCKNLAQAWARATACPRGIKYFFLFDSVTATFVCLCFLGNNKERKQSVFLEFYIKSRTNNQRGVKVNKRIKIEISGGIYTNRVSRKQRGHTCILELAQNKKNRINKESEESAERKENTSVYYTHSLSVFLQLRYGRPHDSIEIREHDYIQSATAVDFFFFF